MSEAVSQPKRYFHNIYLEKKCNGTFTLHTPHISVNFATYLKFSNGDIAIGFRNEVGFVTLARLDSPIFEEVVIDIKKQVPETVLFSPEVC